MAELTRCAFNARDIEPFYVGGTSAALSSDATLLATPLNEEVIITDLTTNSTLHTLEGDGELISALAMTPDGTRLAVVSQLQQLRIYDVQSGEVLKSFKLSAPVYIAAADDTSSLFAFGATDGLVTVWDIAGGFVTHSLKGHGTTICSLTFHGQLHLARWMLASGDTMGTAQIWDLVQRKCIATSNEHNAAVRGLAFSADGEYFMTGGRDEVVVLYKTENLRRVVNTFAVRHLVETCGFMELPDSKVFYTAGAGCQLRLWSIDKGTPLGGSPQPLETSEELVVIDVLQTEDAYWMILSDQTIVELGEAQEVYEGAWAIGERRRLAGNHGIIADLRFAGPDMALVAMATNAPALRLVDPSQPLDVQLLEGHKDLLNCLDVSEDGLWLLSGSKDSEARLWKWNETENKFEQHSVFQGHVGAVTACALPKHTPPRFVITAAADLTVKKWKVQPGTVSASEYTRRAHDKEINALAMAPNDALFATASFDKLGKVWDVESGETVGVLRGHKRGLWDVSFCQYDRVIATCSGDKTARVWLLTDYTCTTTLEGHTNAVQRCRFTKKNTQLVTSGADGLVKVWDTKASECIGTLDNHSNRIWALDVKEDGLSMATADADGNISVWTDNTEQLLQENEEKTRVRVEQEQLLSNYINQNDWSNAFLLALTLEHLMRVYNVVKGAIAANGEPELPVGSVKLEETMKSLDDTQMAGLLRRVRDWNVNFKQFDVAQKVLAVVVDTLNMEAPGIRKVVEAIVPYNERHYLRLDDLIEETYVLDYAVQEMERA